MKQLRLLHAAMKRLAAILADGFDQGAMLGSCPALLRGSPSRQQTPAASTTAIRDP